jgi:predicted regulator of Ras-like GTPase activity (Roadblock/LC7/MglB family)
MASSFREILGRMTGVPCIVAAVLLKADGSMIERSMSEGIDLETVQTIARDMMPLWEWVGRDVEMGRPRALLVERGSGPLSIMPVGADTLLAAMGDRSCSLGRLLRQMTRAKDALYDAAPVAAGADGTDELAPVVERASDLRPEAGRVGEVVVIGANTFRFALSVVTTLARATGVRSASLKTYAPGSIAIDVAFEGDGSLSSIAAGSIGDCSLHVIERTDARLVLGALAPGASPAGHVPEGRAGALALPSPGE